MKKYGTHCSERSNEKRSKYPMWLHWFLHYPKQRVVWRTSVRGSVENIWNTESCVAKTDICLLWERGADKLRKEQIFVLKTYYATYSYRLVKETFRTEFPNSATTLSDSLILRLPRKFKKAGNVQDKPEKGTPHTATTEEHVKEVCEFGCTEYFQYLP